MNVVLWVCMCLLLYSHNILIASEDIVILYVMDVFILSKGRYPEVCEEWRVLGGNLGFLTEDFMNKVIHYDIDTILHLKKIPWKFCLLIFIRSVSRMGVLHGGTWMTLKIPTWDLEHRVICDVIFNPRKIS